MAIDIFADDLDDGVMYGLEGMKILIYGKNTLGKTPQSCKFPKPMLVMGEAGGSALKVKKFMMKKQADFVTLVKQLTDDKTVEKSKERYQTIIIDTVEDIIELFEDQVCREFGVQDCGEVQKAQDGNPNGYSLYRKRFKQQIRLLTGCGYTVIFIAHEETVPRPTGLKDEKGRDIMENHIQPKGSKSDKGASRFIKDLCDFRFYIKSNGVDSDYRTIPSTAWCVETKEFYAGSRFAIQSYVNPFTAQNVMDAIIKAQERSAEEEGAELSSFKMDTTSYVKEDWFEMIKPYVFRLNTSFPQLVINIVEAQLGIGVKLSQATDDNLVQLETIYNNLVELALERGIVVDVDMFKM